MKKYLIFAASALALASCSSDDFLGENPGTAQNATTAINFGGEAGKITRGTSNTGTPQQMLDGQFLVYGVKKQATHSFIMYFLIIEFGMMTLKTQAQILMDGSM